MGIFGNCIRITAQTSKKPKRCNQTFNHIRSDLIILWLKASNESSITVIDVVVESSGSSSELCIIWNSANFPYAGKVSDSSKINTLDMICKDESYMHRWGIIMIISHRQPNSRQAKLQIFFLRSISQIHKYASQTSLISCSTQVKNRFGCRYWNSFVISSDKKQFARNY